MRLVLPKRSSVPRSRASSSASCCPVIAGSAVLYCVTCDQALGSRCVINGAHRDHRLQDLKEAVQDQVKNLRKLSETIKSKERKFHDLTPRIEAAERELEEKCNRTRELLQQEYSSLMSLIEQNQQQAFFILNVQKEMIKQQLHQLLDDAHNYQSKSKAMIDDVEKLSSRQESENPGSMLGEISAFETSLHMMNEFYSSVDKKLQVDDTRLKALENSIKKIVEKNKELLPRPWECSLHTMNEFYSSVDKKLQVDDTRLKALENSIKKIVEKNKELLPRPWEFSEIITLDESRTHTNVQISENKMEMSVNPTGVQRPANPVPWRTALASQKFSKNSHYWEVAVGGCESWVVGVVENRGKGVQTEPAIKEQKNSWILECEGGELSALHNNEFSRVKETKVETVGIFLDCDKGRLKFYNVNTGCVLHTFIIQFKHAVSPTFSIQAQHDSVARLKICNLVHKSEERFDLPDTSVTSESQNEEPMDLSSVSSNQDMI
ncbi:E3 ubiquitin/ISG15 ligase TRIM25 isoform X1 [Silurus asotus]|uniref:E3 ubiquitin/ISG15 ligase TRIM25 isoform X1 n=1 Tax=Silurus asotus TaxID=30991 RepID=A0AAD5FIR0_SILAS|nr:E3 ubiquitin/ISG15 ligase TRIM25 isoform X1 [Silurus asotus]